MCTAPSHISAGQQEMQFCTLLQVSSQLYCDNRNLQSSTQTLSYEMFLIVTDVFS
jgi:hypothetical protein